ncbi:GNAT family N-acetyltransferase [Kitasatospora sp. NPDC094016]|uniref:GNAT family N-acetyltransferase n=1 Tax=unclassified Kitasatospora TaxID=2633591 RepID=UPI003321A5F0
MRIERYDGQEAAWVEDELRTVYRGAFTEPPYDKTDSDVEANFRRFRTQVKKDGFRAVLARADAGEPVGMAYGYPLPASTGWWETLVEPVLAEVSREDGHRTFGLFELAVQPPWRGQHVATAVHHALVDGLTQERVLLNTRPEAEAAGRMYRSWGYEKVGENRPWAGAALHDVLILALPGENPSRR